MTPLPSDPPVLWLRAASSRSVVQAHLAHLAGSFRADGWRVVVGPAPPAAEEIRGALAVLDDPWIEALPAAGRALGEAKRPKESPAPRWRVPRLRGGSGPQGWSPARGPYTLHEARALAIDRHRLYAVVAPDLSPGFAVATAGEAGPLLRAGWPPPPELLTLVPGVRLYRYDDPADHERRELDPFIPDEAENIVDVGCGHGRFGQRLRREGRIVLGIEPDEEMAREASGRLDRVLTARVEEALPTLSDPVDCFVFADVLEHLPDPAQVLRLAARALSPMGRIVVSIPNSAWAPVLRDLAAGRWEPTLAGVQARDHLVPFTLRGLRALAGECDLEVDHLQGLAAPLPWRLRLWAFLVGLSAGGRVRDLLPPQWVVVLCPRSQVPVQAPD
jgi:SAM-dependent methyltransferase